MPGEIPFNPEEYRDAEGHDLEKGDFSDVHTPEFQNDELRAEEERQKELLGKIKILINLRNELYSEDSEKAKATALRLGLKNPVDYARRILSLIKQADIGVNDSVEEKQLVQVPKLSFGKKLRNFLIRKHEQKGSIDQEKKYILKEIDNLAQTCAMNGFTREYIDLESINPSANKSKERKLIIQLFKLGRQSSAIDLAMNLNIEIKGLPPELQKCVDAKDVEGINRYFLNKKIQELSKEYDQEKGGYQHIFAIRFMSGKEFKKIIENGHFSDGECVVSHYLSFPKFVEAIGDNGGRHGGDTLSDYANDWTNYTNARAAWGEKILIETYSQSFREARNTGKVGPEAKRYALQKLVETVNQSGVHPDMVPEDKRFIDQMIENPDNLMNQESLRKFIRLGSHTKGWEMPYEFAVVFSPNYTRAYDERSAYRPEEAKAGISMRISQPGMRWKKVNSHGNIRDQIWAVIPMTQNKDLLNEALSGSDIFQSRYIGAGFAVFNHHGRLKNPAPEKEAMHNPQTEGGTNARIT